MKVFLFWIKPFFLTVMFEICLIKIAEILSDKLYSLLIFYMLKVYEVYITLCIRKIIALY